MANWLGSLYVRLSDLCSEEQGQGLTEYALILALIALVAVIALSFIGGEVTSALSTVGKSMPN